MFEIEGFAELERDIKELEKVPQKVATKSARAGGNIGLRKVKENAPVYDGWLKASLKLVGEKAKKGKKVYEITFDRAYNSKLVKVSKTGKRSYYPVSQEYGWVTKNGKPVHGQQFMKNSAESSEIEIKQKMVDVARVEIDKILNRSR